MSAQSLTIAALAIAGGLAVTLLPRHAEQVMFTGWAEVVETNKNATALIRIEVLGCDPGYGSGVVLSDVGHVLTAKHILPSRAIRERGEFLITSLVGWESPSVDFSDASKLDIVHISEKYDFAILRFRPPLPKTIQPTSGTVNIKLGESVLVMGYPNGGNLRSTVGVASGQASDGRYATDASVGVGSSGGPVLGASAAVLGILLESSKRDADGSIALGYFLLTKTIVDDLTAQELDFEFPLGPPGKLAARRLAQIEFAYPVSQLKDDHQYRPTRQDYERVFPAQDGFVITAARFVSESANHVIGEPDVRIVEGGRQVLVKFTLESGPFFDRWRGWLSGNVVTQQRRRQA